MEKTKYLELAETILQSIDSGKYPVGKPLPGERELAETHSCSRQTVRKAISLLCGEEVLKRVHGRGNFVLKKTRRPKSGLVAVIATFISMPNFANTLLSIENTLTDGGYYPIIATTGNRFDAERRSVEDLLHQNIDGLIVEGVLSTIPNPNIQLYQDLAARGIPVVFLNSNYQEMEDAVHLSMDNLQGGRLCGQYLLAKGHQNFAAVFKADDRESTQRYSGLTRYLSERGFPMQDRNHLWYTSTNMQKPLEDFALTRLENCSAVVCFNDEVAYTLYEILRRSGKKIPDHFEFVAYDKTEFSERIPHTVISLKYPQEAIGKLAAQKIINMIQGSPETSTHLPWQLYDGGGKVILPQDTPGLKRW